MVPTILWLRSLIQKWVTQKFSDSVTKIISLFDFKYMKRSTVESLRSELSYLGRVANVEISSVERVRFKHRTTSVACRRKGRGEKGAFTGYSNAASNA